MTVSYSQRLNALVPAKTWTLQEGGLHWQNLDDEAKSGFIPIESIKSVKLRFEPSRAETRRVGLHIYAPYDHTITNIHYGGILNFIHKPDEFKDFVIAFHQMFPLDTPTKFVSGSTTAGYIFNVLVTIFILAMLLLIAPIVSVTGIPGGTSIFRIVMILIFLPVLLKVLIKNKPAAYRPDDIPLSMLDS